jgi:phosphoribosyl-dephospho-CoA transferase
MAASIHPARHDLVWLDPACAAALRVAGADRAEVDRWLALGWPVVAARRAPGTPEALACLGIPLPPSRGKGRIALQAPVEAVLRRRPPLALDEILESAPPGHREALRELAAEAAALGLQPRVHGSLAWQHLTGQPYADARSDLDLLFAVSSRRQLTGALRMLQRWERRSGLVADAELQLPAGGVAWRELASGAARLLVKQPAGVALMAREALLAPLPAGRAS